MLRTVCYPWHVAHGGRMVDFAGWEMPVQYTSIIAEHQAVRRAVGLFDIAHMGRFKFTGPDACALLDRLLSNDVSRLTSGEVRYSLVTDENGGILDDVLVYRFSSFYLLVVNASNRLKIAQWIAGHSAGFQVDVQDQTLETFMLAVQGPRALDLIHPHAKAELGDLRYYTGCEAMVFGRPAVVSRTGYTGEDGFELIVAAADGPEIWHRLIADGREFGVEPCGLGARDTLRLEAGMPLYGHELTENVDPFTAGLSFAVKLDAKDFVGRAALEMIRADGPRRKRAGLVLSGKRIAREGAVVYSGEREVGKVTSGTFSPTLQKSIAMAYLALESAMPGAAVEIDVRGKREPATVVRLPFYQRAK